MDRLVRECSVRVGQGRGEGRPVLLGQAGDPDVCRSATSGPGLQAPYEPLEAAPILGARAAA
jgi:hypothetical protein